MQQQAEPRSEGVHTRTQQSEEVAAVSPSDNEANEATEAATDAVQAQLATQSQNSISSAQLTQHQRDTLLKLARAAVHDPQVQHAFLQNRQVLQLISMFGQMPGPALQGSQGRANEQTNHANNAANQEEEAEGAGNSQAQADCSAHASGGGEPIANIRISIPELLREGASVISKRFGEEAGTLSHVIVSMIEQAKDAALATFGFPRSNDESNTSSSAGQAPPQPAGDETATSTPAATVLGVPEGSSVADVLGDESAAIASLGLGVACVALSIIVGRRLGFHVCSERARSN